MIIIMMIKKNLPTGGFFLSGFEGEMENSTEGGILGSIGQEYKECMEYMEYRGCCS